MCGCEKMDGEREREKERERARDEERREHLDSFLHLVRIVFRKAKAWIDRKSTSVAQGERIRAREKTGCVWRVRKDRQ